MSESTAEPTPAQDEAVKEAEIDWKAKAREWERRAKENKTAADERDASKSQIDKLTEQLEAVTKAQAEATAQALRYRVAAANGISNADADLFLTGTDEDSITAQAKRLAERDSERKRQGNYVPNEGKTPDRQPEDSERRAFVRRLTGREA